MSVSVALGYLLGCCEMHKRSGYRGAVTDVTVSDTIALKCDVEV